MNGEDAGGFISLETPSFTICAPIQPPALMYFYIKRRALDLRGREDGPHATRLVLFFSKAAPYNTLAAIKQLTSCPRGELLITNLQYGGKCWEGEDLDAATLWPLSDMHFNSAIIGLVIKQHGGN